MRISFQTSGGRGEYELAERSNGLDAAQAVGADLVLRIGRIRIDTQVRVTHQQNKYRLRRHGADVQVARQLAASLLMPQPVRDAAALPAGARRLATQSYIIGDVELDQARLAGGRLTVTAKAIAFDGTGPVNVAGRYNEIARLWRDRDAFPDDIAATLAQHEAQLATGRIGTETERLVRDLQIALAAQGPALGVDFDEPEDPVPALLTILGGPALAGPAEPQPAPPLPTEPPQIKRREIKRARAWLRRRTAATARFSREVRRAYRHRCLICGKRYPATSRTKSGVEAAHILPWSAFDVDETPNGLCLCGTHHWMFDEGLFLIRHDAHAGQYVVVTAPWIDELETSGFSVETVKKCAGPVPAERLPATVADWPSPQLLELSQQYTE